MIARQAAFVGERVFAPAGLIVLAMGIAVWFASWEGFDESDPVTGRGWAVLEGDGSLRGHIYFHVGDDSGFRGERDR